MRRQRSRRQIGARARPTRSCRRERRPRRRASRHTASPSARIVARCASVSSRSKCAGTHRHCAQPRRCRAIAREHRVLLRVPALAHDPAPADHHVAHRRAAGPEYRGIEHVVSAPVRRAPDRPVRAPRDRRAGPRAMAPVRLPQRLRAAARGRAPTAPCPTGASAAAAQHVAPARAHALRPFELAQLGERVEITVFESLPTPKRPSASRYATRRERAVAEIGLGRRRESRDRAARRERRDLALGHVRRVHDAPARVDVRLREQPLDRAHAAPREALLDLARLLGGVDVDRRARAAPGATIWPQLVRRHGAQAVRRDAEHVPRPAARSRAERVDELRERSRSCARSAAAPAVAARRRIRHARRTPAAA